jgi:uncharacterized 2Fe-2S/4Fe-4S cluster protein (DUF4445 family)
MNVSLVFEPIRHRSKVIPGTTILDASKQEGIRINSDCGGIGTCGKCKVIVEAGSRVSPLNLREQKYLTQEEINKGYRLACQTSVEGDTIVHISEDRSRKFQVNGINGFYPLSPLITKTKINLSATTKQSNDPYSELSDILHGKDFVKDLGHLKFGSWLENHMPTLETPINTLAVWDEFKVISLEAGDTSQKLFGTAIDLGTSKIVGHLIDLSDGRSVAISQLENPQNIHGEDVISRLTYAIKSTENLDELHYLLNLASKKILEDLYLKTGVNADDVYGAVVVGNTLMHHFFLGVKTDTLARAPFEPLVKDNVEKEAFELELPINKGGIIHMPYPIAGFVGSDAVAGIVATRMHEAEEPTMFVDIGTNTEVFIGDKSGMTCCSCASGPAFEGGHISQGMKAVTGAIEHIKIENSSYEVSYDTIDDEKPAGICGSGMIDALAELWRTGLIDNFGRLNHDLNVDRVRKGENGAEFIIEWKEKTSINRDIKITSEDIQELLLAKAAIHSGSSIMMIQKGLVTEDLKTVYVAGAFGENIDPVNITMIGMLPDIRQEKIVFAGNTAIMGAKAILISKEAREIAQNLRNLVYYHELSIDPNFNNEFLDSLFLPHRDADRFPSALMLKS